MPEILIWGWDMYIASFFEGRGFVENRFEGEPLILMIVMVEGIVFVVFSDFEGRRFVGDGSEDELLVLVIVVIMVEGIMFAVFNSGDMRDLIVSIIVNLTNSIISLFIASERYEGWD
jgi:hypothetical protein